ncbi:MAG: hypothetical protein HC851_15260 [Acaryochloris sp. RU_4_1]|nr:hypothetical protein [Acaryochloris sp. SU_5_25]NJM66921.1 hypothetical protein [Acaryochloris sp. RU_4_1]NJN38263.1 hypothetical protein [Acaryochloridaceae cyanobacterium CSU_3_4]NJR55763.1 hypothetical protein [Acaryochloris sp. CRU_2_0]
MNFGTPVPLIVGVVLIVGAIGLFFLDKIKPGCHRDSDTVYAFLSLLAGVILLAHLGMEFTLSLQQMIMVGMLVALMIENIQSRVPGSRPKQVGDRRFDREDDYRPRRPQRRDSMRAEAQLELEDELIAPTPRSRRIRGEGKRRSSRDDYAQQAYDEEYDDSSHPSSVRRRSTESYDAYDQDNAYGQDRYSSYDSSYSQGSPPSPASSKPVEERTRRRRPLQLKGEIEDKTYTPDDYSSAVKAMRNRRRQQSAPSETDSDPANSTGGSYSENGNSDYVDYKPLDLPRYPDPKSGPDRGGSY